MLFSISVFANTNNDNIIVNDSEVTTDFSRENVNGCKVDISIDKEIVEDIKGHDIEDILEEGLGTVNDEIEIVSQDTLTEEKLDDINDSFYIYTNNNELVGITVPDQIKEKDIDIVLDLAENVGKNGDIINIKEIVDIEQPEEQENNWANDKRDIIVNNMDSLDTECPEDTSVSTEALTYYIENGPKKKSGNEYKAKDIFVLSVAKGQSITLKKSITNSINISMEGGVAFDATTAKAGMKTSIKSIYSKSATYDSKDMAKGKNSREFRTRFYKQKYKRTQYKKRKLTHKTIDTTQVTYGVPTKYANYSVDVYVKR